MTRHRAPVTGMKALAEIATLVTRYSSLVTRYALLFSVSFVVNIRLKTEGLRLKETAPKVPKYREQ